jgi:protein TonB
MLLLLPACNSLPGKRTMTIQIDGKVDPQAYRYLQHISKKIEIIGNSRYPNMQKIIQHRTHIDIEMIIHSGGKLRSVQLLNPGKQPQLEAMLLELIQYSAPYPPLPEELDIDELVIQKRWQFNP